MSQGSRGLDGLQGPRGPAGRVATSNQNGVQGDFEVVGDLQVDGDLVIGVTNSYDISTFAVGVPYDTSFNEVTVSEFSLSLKDYVLPIPETYNFPMTNDSPGITFTPGASGATFNVQDLSGTQWFVAGNLDQYIGTNGSPGYQKVGSVAPNNRDSVKMSMVSKYNNATFSFTYMTSTEKNYDFLNVYKNGSKIFRSSTQYTNGGPISDPAVFTTTGVLIGDIFMIEFKKDNNGLDGVDSVFVNNISITGFKGQLNDDNVSMIVNGVSLITNALCVDLYNNMINIKMTIPVVITSIKFLINRVLQGKIKLHYLKTGFHQGQLNGVSTNFPNYVINTTKNTKLNGTLTVTDIALGTDLELKYHSSLKDTLSRVGQLLLRTEQESVCAHYDVLDTATWARIRANIDASGNGIGIHDYIVVGSGPGGAMCTNMLAACGSASKRVLMIEQGRRTYPSDMVILPTDDRAPSDIVSASKGVFYGTDGNILTIPGREKGHQEIMDLFRNFVEPQWGYNLWSAKPDGARDDSGNLYKDAPFNPHWGNGYSCPITDDGYVKNGSWAFGNIMGGGSAVNGGILNLPNDNFIKKVFPGVDLNKFKATRYAVQTLMKGDFSTVFHDYPVQDKFIKMLHDAGFDSSGALDASGNEINWTPDKNLMNPGGSSSETPLLGTKVTAMSAKTTKLGWTKRIISTECIAYYAGDNLDVLFDTEVVKVLFDSSKNTTGIIVIRNGKEYTINLRESYQSLVSKDTNGDYKYAMTKSEVIIGGGTYNSPVLLEKSGIGRDDASGTRVAYNSVYTNNNVGENYWNQYVTGFPTTVIHASNLPLNLVDMKYESLVCAFDNREMPDGSGGNFGTYFIESGISRGNEFNLGQAAYAHFTWSNPSPNEKFLNVYQNGKYAGKQNTQLPRSVVADWNVWLRANSTSIDVDSLTNENGITNSNQNARISNEFINYWNVLNYQTPKSGSVHWDSSNNNITCTGRFYESMDGINHMAIVMRNIFNGMFSDPSGFWSLGLTEAEWNQSGLQDYSNSGSSSYVKTKNNILVRRGSPWCDLSDLSDTTGVGSLDFWKRRIIEGASDSIHMGGTCMAGPEIPGSETGGGVVDPVTFEVYGVKGLRCCSSEVFPSATASNTQGYYMCLGHYIGRKILDFDTLC